MTRYPIAWLVCVGVAAAGLAAAVAWIGSQDTLAAPRGDRSAVAPRWTSVASSPALDVLHGWDRRRAAAYARGDTAGLRALYVDGGGAAAADVRMLRSYTRRGLTVTGMRMQVLEATVLSNEPDRYRLRVTDRLVGAVAVGDGTRVRLPRDRASSRVITLTRTSPAAAWRVVSVSPSSRRPAGR